MKMKTLRNFDGARWFTHNQISADGDGVIRSECSASDDDPALKEPMLDSQMACCYSEAYIVDESEGRGGCSRESSRSENVPTGDA